jgi:hypothetical protein
MRRWRWRGVRVGGKESYKTQLPLPSSRHLHPHPPKSSLRDRPQTHSLPLNPRKITGKPYFTLHPEGGLEDHLLTIRRHQSKRNLPAFPSIMNMSPNKRNRNRPSAKNVRTPVSLLHGPDPVPRCSRILARELGKDIWPIFSAFTPVANRHALAFATLKKHGRLRKCLSHHCLSWTRMQS